MGKDSAKAGKYRCRRSFRYLTSQNSTQEAYLDEFFRGRLRSLQPVDELVQDVVRKLEAAGQLDNTYIFYTCTSRHECC